MADEKKLDPTLAASLLKNLEGLLGFAVPPPPAGQPAPPSPASMHEFFAAIPASALQTLQAKVEVLPGAGGDFGRSLLGALKELSQATLLTSAVKGDQAAIFQLQVQEDERKRKEAAATEAAKRAAKEKEEEDTRKAGLKAGIGGLRSIASGQFNEQTFATMFKGFGDAATGTSKLVPALGTFLSGLVTAVEWLGNWNKRLQSIDFAFAEFSGSMARVVAQTRFQEAILAHQRGERRAASTAEREQSRIALERTWAPIGDQIAIFGNSVMTGLNRIAELLLKLIPGGGGGTAPDTTSLSDWMEGTGETVWMSRYGFPMPGGGP